jgi:transposase InsO family protein
MQYYGPELEQRLRRYRKATNKSWRVDETYVRVKGRWCYLYRAIDSTGATIDFLLSALRDADAAKCLFRKALSDRAHPQPRVINTDLAPIYSSAIPDSKKEGTLRNRCRHRPVQYLNNILEQDHRAIKHRQCQTRLPRIPGGPANHSRLRSSPYDPEGTDSMGGRKMIGFARLSSSNTSSIWQPERTCAHAITCLRLKVATLPNGMVLLQRANRMVS